MATAINAADSRGRVGKSAETATTVSLVFVSVWLLSAFGKLLVAYYTSAASRTWAWVAIPVSCALLVSGLLSNARYADFIPLMGIALRSSAAGMLAYLLLEPVDFTLANEAAASAAQYVGFGYFVSLAIAVISLYRPSFVAPVAVYILSTRCLSEAISGYSISTLDIRYMMDMAIYLTLIAVPVVTMGPRVHSYFKSPSRQIEMVFVAFGLHLGNYFWSGIAKLLIGPHLWTWVMENRTFNTISYAIENGTLPIGHLPWAVTLIYGGMQALVIPINGSIVALQLFAIICVYRTSWLKLASLFYDLLHVGIYAFCGILFWPWIWNNFTIWLAMRSERPAIQLTPKFACVLTILLGYPALGFYGSASLGWFDLSDVRRTYFEAVTKDGHVERVPPSFFLSHSYSVSQGFMDTAAHKGQYAQTWWNSGYSYERQRTSGACLEPEPVAPASLETDEQRAERLGVAEHFILAHHAKMKSREELLGKGSFYFRVHHHPSNPYLFSGFDRLSLSDIAGYNLVTESVCLRMRDGKVERTLVRRDSDYFDVR